MLPQHRLAWIARFPLLRRFVPHEPMRPAVRAHRAVRDGGHLHQEGLAADRTFEQCGGRLK
jgi:hypothetical protein